MQKIAFIAHGRHVSQKLCRELDACFAQVDHAIHTTTRRSEAIELTVQAIADGATDLVAVGGDGTLNEVINGIMSANETAGKCSVTVYPSGSGNDVARMFGISRSIAELQRRIELQRFRELDLLQIECFDSGGNRITRYCLNVADAGLGGYVTQVVDSRPRWMNASLKYFSGVVQGLLQYKKCEMTVRTESEVWSGTAMSICLANCVYFGSGMGIAPHAIPDDGLAAITIIGDVTVFDYIRLTPALRKAKRLCHSQVQYLQARECNIEASRECPIEIDGEYVGHTPLTMHVLRRAIKFLH